MLTRIRKDIGSKNFIYLVIILAVAWLLTDNSTT